MPNVTRSSQLLQREMARIRSGLKFAAVQNLQRSLDLPAEKLAGLLGMSRATFHRRKVQGRIARDESEKVLRYERLLARATDVFDNADDARSWLRAPQRALGGATPLDFAGSEMGSREVENLLGRLEHGVYS